MLDCLNLSWNVSSSASGKYNITSTCAFFDFALYTVFSGSLCVMGCVGNTLSFLVLWKDKGNHSATSFLLRGLAASDTLVLLAAVPLYVLPAVYPHAGYLEEYYVLYVDIMPFLWPVYLVPFTGSVLLTVLVSFDRYFAVCRPLKYSSFLFKKRLRALVLLVACFSVVYNLPRFVEYEKAEVCTGPNETHSVFQISAFGANIFYRIIYANLLYFLLIHGGPLVSLAFFNYKLVQTLRSREERRRAETRRPGSVVQKDITFVLVVVIFVFIVCQTPTLVDHVLWTVVDEDQRACGHWHYYYTAVGDALAILNSSVNFVVYVLTSQRFRRRLVGWFACRRAGGAGAVFSTRCHSETGVDLQSRLCRAKTTSLIATVRLDLQLHQQLDQQQQNQ